MSNFLPGSFKTLQKNRSRVSSKILCLFFSQDLLELFEFCNHIRTYTHCGKTQFLVWKFNLKMQNWFYPISIFTPKTECWYFWFFNFLWPKVMNSIIFCVKIQSFDEFQSSVCTLWLFTLGAKIHIDFGWNFL